MAHLFEMRGLRKSYDVVKALAWDDATTVTVAPGRVLGLAGENGAGKSTLLGAIVGSVALDAGELRLDGASYEPHGPFDALSKGVAMIPQETLLSPTLTVAENVLLGREAEYTRFGVINGRRRDRLAREALGLVELDIDLRGMCGSLVIEHKKMIELARALAARPRVLLVDETSNVLSRDGAQILFDRIASFAAAGGAVVFVTHRLDEISTYCDEVTVLKDGKVVATHPTGEVSESDIAHLMVGRELEGEISHLEAARSEPGEVVLSVRALRPAGCAEFSLDLRAGEIVGIGGLVGCGADAVARTLAGALPAAAGRIVLSGTDVTGLGLPGRIAAGIAYVPKDRDDEGLLLGASIRDNIALGSLDRYSRAGFMALSAGSAAAEEQISDLSIKAGSHRTLVSQLSGGNRQKVLLGRWLHRDVPVLVLNNPTRGVDVGAKTEIYRLLEHARAAGKAIVIVSDELPELLRLSDRVLIMRHGAVTTEEHRPLPTEQQLIGAML
ncbi:sugar ABC transporter ATP-binding protein [Paractinoplanes durhamensis]|uniref:Ribose import ATP-binding protein RbsA n=1 Tax=Paractinoplanes durhamensis TaxID=113563 RepID=A0ABQ3YU22_9ACTN|nr:sugar ABC transporter ATP-binding protein [Actinoplanes durhamensis]GIE01097.1 ribose import ATP-binding protein RbsA [Actinoplanes durhamensis]